MTIDAVEIALEDILTANSGVTALVAQRVYAMKMPQNPTYPLITYFRVSGPRVESMQGASGLASPRFQIDIWAKTYAETKAIARAVQLALEGYRATVGTVPVQGILFDSDRDLYESTPELYRVSMDFVIWHNE